MEKTMPSWTTFAKKITLLSILSIFAIPSASAGNFIYPFNQIAKPECRYSKWTELKDECKMSIPRIENANYEKFKKDTKFRRIYSVLWGATYDFGWDSGQGSHQWVDIATSEGTPVIAIGEGEVVNAGALSGWGNTVSVKHRLSDGKTIFSNYSHLFSVTVKKGQKVRQGEELWTVGNTWNSYGNHLHFQIDTSDQSHPYYFVTCGKGTDPVTLVNKGMCRDYLEKNTVDPIAFLEGGAISTPITTAQIQAIQNVSKNVTIDRKTIKSREQIEEEEIQEFFRNRSFQIVAGISRTQIQAGKESQVILRVFENGKPYSGILPAGGLDIDQNTIISTFPAKILLVEKGSRTISITGKKSGKTDLVVHIGKKVRQSVPIVVYKANEFKTVNRMEIRQKPAVFLGSNTVGAAIVRTPYGTPQVNVPYDGTFVLTAIQGKAKFCNVSDTMKANCPTSRMTDSIEFDYSKTKQGVLVFQMSPLDFTPIQLEIREKKGNRKVWTGKAGIRVDIPLGMDNRTPYFESIVWALKSGISTTDRYGYIQSANPLLVQEMRPILQQYVSWLERRYPERKSKIRDLANRMATLNGTDGYSTVSRWQFAKILTGNPPIIWGNRNKYLDQKGEFEPAIEWLSGLGWFEWKDAFGGKYFQPNVPIKLWEALYLLETVGQNAYKL